MSIDPIASRLAENGVAYAPQIAQAARQNGLDPGLLAAVAAQETGGPGSNSGHNIVGDGGHGRGVFQIDDRWHPFATTPAAMDPASNANYAAGMLAGLLKRYGGNVREALSAYNSGSPTATGTKTRWADGSDLGYADSVLRHYRQLGGAATLPGSVQATAIAESPAEVASVGALGAAAQRYPPPLALPAPGLGAFASGATAQAHAFHRQPTDYVSLFTDDTNETDS
ncbi:MAG TPA: transglycosylase SLT domain-containing protein [Candidatus Cybelea sp.]|nr:transglycosylase SLT domain-containing protein [Candidatus Cybelea sp.]